MKKKECERTRKALPRYLRGHVFAPDRKRIERHLKACALCSSEFQALKHTAETRQIIKDITPPEGITQKVRAGVSSISALKKLLYRPLWVLGLAALAAVVYLYVITPLMHDRDFEGLETASPSGTAAVSPVPSAPANEKPAAAEPKQEKQKTAAAVPSLEPLAVTITVENEQAAMRRINEVMKGHALLRTMRFSDTVKEISGNLTAKELLTFFNRIETAGTISYSRSRLEAFPSAQPLPFVIRIKMAPAAAVKPPERPAPVEKPAPEIPPAQ